MSKVLVVYATKSGSVNEIADMIGQTLAAEGAAVEVVSADNAGSPDGYDAVVIGSGVRAGTWHEPARTWLSKHAPQLRAMPVAFYTVGLMITQGDEKVAEVRAYTDKLVSETAVQPVDTGLFGGWNEPEAFSFIERNIMKLMKAPVGDFRDWDAIAAWTKNVAPQLQVT